jgi:RNA polymerase sigma-70 factor (ECF subfamily)
MRSIWEATMSSDATFADLIARVRAGDSEAAAEIVRRYEPEIRRAVRLRLTDPNLRRVLDSLDICQSVLTGFFVRAAAGQFELNQPDQLLKLLVTMARNKLRDQVSYHRAARRDQRRLTPAALEPLAQVAGSAPSPSAAVVALDMLQAVRAALSPEERELADQRALGRDWNSIAAEKGVHPDTLRKRLTTALDRVARQLGLETNRAEALPDA